MFDYELRRAGWATATFCLGAAPVAVAVSYLHDSLRDMARALLGLDASPDEVAGFFVDEPGTVVLVMRRPDDHALDLELFRFQDWISQWPPRREERPESLGSARHRWRTFRGGVMPVLQRLLRVHRTAGYLKLWAAHPFPIEELRVLESRRP